MSLTPIHRTTSSPTISKKAQRIQSLRRLIANVYPFKHPKKPSPPPLQVSDDFKSYAGAVSRYIEVSEKNPQKLASSFFQDGAWIIQLQRRIETTLSRQSIYRSATDSEESRAAYNQLLRQDKNLYKKLSAIDKIKVVLPDGAEEKVARAMKQSPDSTVATGFNMIISADDLRTLRDGKWLNDEVINFYGEMLMDRSRKTSTFPKIHYFNTFFYTSLCQGGYPKVRRWSKKFDVFALDYVIIPVHLGMHWCCAVINFKKKLIEYYDSLLGRNDTLFKVLRNYLEQESIDKKKKPFNLEEWKDHQPKDIPKQMNGYDCGVFTIMFAEHVSREAEFGFSQDNMPVYRKCVAYEIITSKLLDK